MLAPSPHTHVLLLLRKALFAVRQRLSFAYFICEAMRGDADDGADTVECVTDMEITPPCSIGGAVLEHRATISYYLLVYYYKVHIQSSLIMSHL